MPVQCENRFSGAGFSIWKWPCLACHPAHDWRSCQQSTRSADRRLSLTKDAISWLVNLLRSGGATETSDAGSCASQPGVPCLLLLRPTSPEHGFDVLCTHLSVACGLVACFLVTPSRGCRMEADFWRLSSTWYLCSVAQRCRPTHF